MKRRGARALFLAALCLPAGLSAAAEEVQVVKSGKYWGKIEAYRAGDYFYLGAKQAARIYGGQRYWYAARGRVQLSFRGKQVGFRRGALEANVTGKKVRMPRPMIVRAGRAFIPIEFFQMRAFSDVVGVDSRFNEKTRLLLVDRRSSVGPLRWFTYPDHTRVVLELRDDLRYQTRKSGVNGYDISIPNGLIDWSEKIDVQDGVLEYIHLFQESKQTRLSLRMQGGSGGVRLREFKKPRRVVLDIARAEDAARAARSRRISVEAPAARPVKTRRAKARRTPADAGSLGGAAAAAKKTRKAVPLSGSKKRYRIMVDAGHGGKDGGTVGRRGTLEKTINLHAALELARLLKEEGVFDVRLTRKDDTFVKLGERTRLANAYQADLFISIHCNAHPSRGMSGFEVYFLSERASDPDAERLAEFENSVLSLEGEGAPKGGATSVLFALAKTEFINDSAELGGILSQSLSKRVDLRNRGVKQAAFYVLRGVYSPAVLVEMAFLSNARDEAKLQSGKYRRKIVEGLYAGVVKFARRKGWSSGAGR